MRLKEIMEKKGITQKEMRLSLGISSSTLSQYVNNKRQPDGDRLYAMARYLNVSVEELLGHPKVPTEQQPDDPYHFAERINNLSDENLLALQRYLDFLEASQQNDQPSSNTPAEGR